MLLFDCVVGKIKAAADADCGNLLTKRSEYVKFKEVLNWRDINENRKRELCNFS